MLCCCPHTHSPSLGVLVAPGRCESGYSSNSLIVLLLSSDTFFDGFIVFLPRVLSLAACPTGRHSSGACWVRGVLTLLRACFRGQGWVGRVAACLVGRAVRGLSCAACICLSRPHLRAFGPFLRPCTPVLRRGRGSELLGFVGGAACGRA